jgi:hypothetical protein
MVSNRLIGDHKKGKEKKSPSDACAEQASRAVIDGYNEEHIGEKESTTFVVLREITPYGSSRPLPLKLRVHHRTV